MLTNLQRKTINSFYDRLYFIDNKSITQYRERLLAMELKDEKQHRGYDSARFHCTPTEAAKYFAVKHILDGLSQPTFKAEDILHLRYGYLYGAGIAQEFKAQIVKEFTPAEISEFLTLDYVKMVT